MLSPVELILDEVENTDFKKLEKLIDDSIKRHHGCYPWEKAILEGELSVSVRNEIAQTYKMAGWKYIYHRTTSENGEKPGLTSFMFSEKEIEDKYTKNYHKI